MRLIAHKNNGLKDFRELIDFVEEIRGSFCAERVGLSMERRDFSADEGVLNC